MKKTLMLLGVLIMLPALASAQQKLDVDLMSCRDLLCTDKSSSFLINEYAYVDYNSSVKGISYSAILTFPDGNKTQFMFPNRITSNVTGDYTVEIIAWKEGYEDSRASITIQFAGPGGPVTGNPPTLDIRFLLVIIILVIIIALFWRFGRKSRKKNKAKKKR